MVPLERQTTISSAEFKKALAKVPFSVFTLFWDYTLFYKQPHFQVEPRVAMKISEMRLKVAIRLLSIFGIEAQGC